MQVFFTLFGHQRLLFLVVFLGLEKCHDGVNVKINTMLYLFQKGMSKVDKFGYVILNGLFY